MGKKSAAARNASQPESVILARIDALFVEEMRRAWDDSSGPAGKST